MTTTNNSLTPFKYPIICFYSGMAEILATEKEFTCCNTRAFKQGCFRNWFVVDSQGLGYSIKGAERIGTVSPFFGIRIFERLIRVKPIIDSEPVKTPLDKTKEMLSKTVKKDPSFWSAAGSIKEIEREIDQAQNYGQIMNLLFFRSL